MKNEFLLAIGALAAEKNLPKEVVFEAVEAALSSAYKRDGEPSPNVYVKISPDTGDFYYYRQMTVVDEVEDPEVEMSLAQARRYKADAEEGDVLDFEEKPPENAGRIAAQTAKQVVLQRLREAERDAVYDEYVTKEGELLVGTVQRVEPRAVIIDLGKGTEAILPFSEQVRNEHLRSGQRVKVYILEVQKAAKGPQIVVSRGHRNLLRRLFEMEVPEIASGIVEVKSIAREGGHRSKVAVYSRDARVDPIGACVGMRGSRIQNVVNELGGERIDVIKWDPDPANFVSNALSPAQVLEVEVDVPEHSASVVVPDRMFSLAIGKEGQNARLAAKLTSWRITIRNQSAAAGVEGGTEETVSFVPFAPGEEPDIDIIAEAEEIAAEAAAIPPVAAEAAGAAAALAPTAGAEAGVAPEEDISFTAGLAEVPIPDREERESEDYGEEEEEEDEEYEVPTMVAPELRPTQIRFAEDVLPKRPEEAEEAPKKGAAKKARRPARFEEVDEEEDFDYSGRIR
jgi:N utilization substance protein A